MKKLLLIAATMFSFVAAQAQCQANFGHTNVGNVFSFTDSSTTVNGNVSGWLWNFGDNTASSLSQNPQHTYVACGTYTVMLTIFTSSFCSNSYTDTVYVSQGAQPTFTYTVDTTTGTANFTGAPFSTNLTYAWDFGDNSTGTGQVASHTYAASGTYNVCLTISDPAGICTYMICDTVVVYIAPPTCTVTWVNQSFIAGQQTFAATPIDMNWTYTWDFGDNSTGTGFAALHNYTASGTYTVCLTVLDTTNGCTSMFCDTVIVSLPASCPVSFTNTYLLGNMAFTPTPFNPLNTYVWDFGDASPQFTGFLANHMYAAPGTYTVCVVMTTFQGCTSTFCDTVIVPNTIGYAEYQSGILGVMAYPNPASSNIAVNYTLARSSDVTFELIDLSGRMIYARTESEVQPGTQRAEISLDGFAAGSYILRVRTATGATYLPFVKE